MRSQLAMPKKEKETPKEDEETPKKAAKDVETPKKAAKEKKTPKKAAKDKETPKKAAKDKEKKTPPKAAAAPEADAPGGDGQPPPKKRLKTKRTLAHVPAAEAAVECPAVKGTAAKTTPPLAAQPGQQQDDPEMPDASCATMVWRDARVYQVTEPGGLAYWRVYIRKPKVIDRHRSFAKKERASHRGEEVGGLPRCLADHQRQYA